MERSIGKQNLSSLNQTNFDASLIESPDRIKGGVPLQHGVSGQRSFNSSVIQNQSLIVVGEGADIDQHEMKNMRSRSRAPMNPTNKISNKIIYPGQFSLV